MQQQQKRNPQTKLPRTSYSPHNLLSGRRLLKILNHFIRFKMAHHSQLSLRPIRIFISIIVRI